MNSNEERTGSRTLSFLHCQEAQNNGFRRSNWIKYVSFFGFNMFHGYI